MHNFEWLAQEAKNIHLIFENLFYTAVGFLICVGVFLEQFKTYIGGTPSIGPLVGRAFIAAIMLISFPEFLNLVGSIADQLSSQIGQLNEFKLVLEKMGDRLDTLTWSWTSVKQTFIVIISFLTFFILYISVYVSEAIYFYSWTLLYIFSPLCFSLFVLPQTEAAAKGIYSSIIKVASWKVIWGVLATLLWSAALIDLEKLGNDVDFFTIVLFNLMLAGSLLFTPLISNMLFSGKFATAAAKVGGAATGAMMLAANKAMGIPSVKQLGQGAKAAPGRAFQSLNSVRKSYADKKAIESNPSLKMNPEKLPSYQMEQKQTQKKLEKMDRQAIRKSPYLKYMPNDLPSKKYKLNANKK